MSTLKAQYNVENLLLPVVTVTAATPELRVTARALASELGLPYQDDAPASCAFILAVTPDRIELRTSESTGAVHVDFTAGVLAHRRRFGGGRGQPLARAVGLKKGASPQVLDATAGLGRDAFVLATLGCAVHMIERSPISMALLRDGLQRAYNNAEIGDMVQQRMKLTFGNAPPIMSQLRDSERPDVVYLDPMYPHRNKSAQVKKEMRAFQLVIGEDADSVELLNTALACARQRVVVKRPRLAPPIMGPKASMIIESKNTRYDVYLTSLQSAHDPKNGD